MELFTPPRKISFTSGSRNPEETSELATSKARKSTYLLLYPLLFSCSLFRNNCLNNAPHRRYLTEFWICFTI